MLRRLVSLSVAALIAALLVVPDANATPPRVTLTMWCSPYAAEAGWAIDMVSRWNRVHPDVQVRLQKMPAERVAEDVLREAIKDRKTPDVCAHMFPVNVHEYVKMGGLLPLDGHTTLMAASQRRSGPADAFRSTDGHLYQIPWKCNPIMLQYNRALLGPKQQPPRTYGQFLAMAEVFRRRGIQAWAPAPVDRWYSRYYDFYPLYIAATSGKTFLDASQRPAVDEAAATAIFEFIARTFKSGYASERDLYPTPSAQTEAFASGKLAFLITGPWNIQLMSEFAGSTVKFGFAPLMVPDGTDPKRPVYSYGNFRNISVFSTCQHPKEAAALIEFLISQPADLAFLEAASQLPYRPSLQSDPAFQALLKRNPHLAVFARQLPWVRPVENTPLFNRILGAFSKPLAESAVKGTSTPQQAVREAIDVISRLFPGT